MKGSVLQEAVEEKDLEVWVSNDLKFSTNVAKYVSKANQILGLIRRSFTYPDSQLMRLLLTALGRLHLEYMVALSGTLQKDIQVLEKVQQRAIRMGLVKLQYEDRWISHCLYIDAYVATWWKSSNICMGFTMSIALRFCIVHWGILINLFI